MTVLMEEVLYNAMDVSVRPALLSNTNTCASLRPMI